MSAAVLKAKSALRISANAFAEEILNVHTGKGKTA
jgi:hypothetical protein